MNEELLTRALQPGHSSTTLLREMASDARRDVVEALAAAIVRREAVELADALADGPLTAAVEAAQGPFAAFDAARKALADEEHSIAARLAEHFKRVAAGAAAGGRDPDRETLRLRELREAVNAAEQEAFPYTNAVTIIEEQIAGLRAAPPPDPAVLAVIAEALKGGGHEAH